MTDARFPAASQESRHVLIIDDEPAHLETLKVRLESSGYSCSAAQDNPQVWQELEAKIPHLVVLNIGNPHEKWLSFLHRLRSFRDPGDPQKEKQLRQIPVIAITGTDERVKVLLEQGHISAMVKKPVDFQVLRKLIEETLSDSTR